MTKRTYVFDTSVLLTNAKAIYEYNNHDIVIPMKVLEELDKHKNRQDSVGHQARNSIRIFDSLRVKNSLQKGVRLDKGKGTVRISCSDISLLPDDLDPRVPDNRIISTALREKQNSAKSHKVILVTRDINMRVVCDSLGFPCETYDPEKALNDKENLYSGYSEILVDEEYIDRFYKGDVKILPEGTEQEGTHLPNEFMMLRAAGNEKKTALARYYGNGEIQRVNGKKREVFGVQARNREQTFAMNLLLDPEVKIVTLVGKAGSGKAQPLDSNVLTPHGWKPMGDIQVGDNVISIDGKPTRVNGVFPQGKKEIYRVFFTDGSSVECCKEHLWKTQTSLERDQKKDGKVRSLEEIMSSLRYGKSKKRNHSIPMVKPIDFAHIGMSKLEIDPYLLGCLIGDGCFRHSLSFSTMDEEILEELNPILLKEDCVFTDKRNKCDYYIVQNQSSRVSGISNNSIKRKIEALGLWMKRSDEKFIPDEYLFSSLEDRISLLRGLMDTDGTVSKNGRTITFTTTSQRMSKQFEFLVQSLGGTAVTSFRQTTYCHDGERRLGKISYRTYICLPNEINPFLLNRKASLVKKRVKYFPRRYIDKVEYVGEKEAQCILVEHDEHLYVTENCIVTHNTLCAIAAGLHQLMEEGTYSRMLISRPVQPLGKDIGFLPGTMEEKMLPWLTPIQDNLQYLLGNDKVTLEEYMNRGVIEIEALTYIRGRSIANAFVVIDESQNLTVHELKTIITRVGEGTKIVLTGDIEQIDNAFINDVTNGLTHAVEKFKDSPLAGHVTLIKGERSSVATLAARVL